MRRSPPARLQPHLLPRPTPTLFIECTHTFHSDLNTGIQRVVRNVLRNATAAASRYGYAVVPVILDRGQLIAVDAGPVFADKLRTAMQAGTCGQAEAARVDFRTRVRRLVHKIWRVLLQGLSRMSSLRFRPALPVCTPRPSWFRLVLAVPVAGRTSATLAAISYVLISVPRAGPIRTF